MTVTAQRQDGNVIRFLRLLCLSLFLTSCAGATVVLAQTNTTGPTAEAAKEDSNRSKKSTTVEADSEITAKYTPPLETFKLSVDGYEAAVKETATSDDRLKEMPAQLDQLRLKIRTYIDTLKPLMKQSSDRQIKLKD